MISRFTANPPGAIPAQVDSELVILEIPQPFRNHNGGQLAFGPDGKLYISLGDGGLAGDPQGNGQNTSTLLGSILRIDVSGVSSDNGYRVPLDNPFVDVPGARPKSGLMVSGIPGGSLLTGRPETCGQATSAKTATRKST